MIELPSGHQTVSTLIELFTDDKGSHSAGSGMKLVYTVNLFGTLHLILGYTINKLDLTIIFYLLINLTGQY